MTDDEAYATCPLGSIPCGPLKQVGVHPSGAPIVERDHTRTPAGGYLAGCQVRGMKSRCAQCPKSKPRDPSKGGA